MSRQAAHYGLDLDASRSLCIVHDSVDINWRALVAFKHDVINRCYTTTLDGFKYVYLTANFTRCVPCINRGYTFDNIVDYKSELNVLDTACDSCRYGYAIYLPILDAFKRAFLSESNVCDILLALAKHGSMLTFLKRDEDRRKKLIAEQVRAHAEFRKKTDELNKLAKTYPLGKKDPGWKAQAMNIANAFMSKLSIKDQAFSIDIIGKPCRTFEEIAIWLDLNDAA